MGSDDWTALLAVTLSHRKPQPDQRAENTITGRDAAIAKMKAVDPKLIAERDSRRIEIAKLLIAARANLDLDDGHGATALASSVNRKLDELSLLLISSGAKLDLLLVAGANAAATDKEGRSPAYWCKTHDRIQLPNDEEKKKISKLLEAATKHSSDGFRP